MAVKSCLHVLDKAILQQVGEHCKNYAAVQDRLAGCLKQFILGATGNVELNKDHLHRNCNFMSEEDSVCGSTFLRKLQRSQEGQGHLDLVSTLKKFEERFLSSADKQFLLMILESIDQGKTVKVIRKEEPKPLPQTLAPSDKENIKNIVDMFQGAHTNELVK